MKLGESSRSHSAGGCLVPILPQDHRAWDLALFFTGLPAPMELLAFLRAKHIGAGAEECGTGDDLSAWTQFSHQNSGGSGGAASNGTRPENPSLDLGKSLSPQETLNDLFHKANPCAGRFSC